MGRRSLPWSSALRDLRDDRAKPKPIREERLAQPNRSAWRGESGKRYVVVRGELSLDGVANLAGPSRSLVLIAAHRVGIVGAEVVDLYQGSIDSADLAGWLESARLGGATELHAHHLAYGAKERAAVVADLTDDALRARQAAIAECRDGIAALIGEAA